MGEYRGLFGRHARRRCPHASLAGIYGDEINHVGGWRLLCRDCWRYLDGPVSLATRPPTDDHVHEPGMTCRCGHEEPNQPQGDNHE